MRCQNQCLLHHWFFLFTILCNEVYRRMLLFPLKRKAVHPWYTTWKVPFKGKGFVKWITGLAFWKSLSDHKGHGSSWLWTSYDFNTYLPQLTWNKWEPRFLKCKFSVASDEHIKFEISIRWLLFSVEARNSVEVSKATLICHRQMPNF